MPESKHKQDALPAESFEQLRHDLLNPLSTIRGRAQLMTRAIERSSSMNDSDRDRLLRGLTAISQAVFAAVEVLERADPRNQDGEARSEQ
jgi:nitrogen-specific signal transduction histidine kinase